MVYKLFDVVATEDINLALCQGIVITVFTMAIGYAGTSSRHPNSNNQSTLVQRAMANFIFDQLK